MGFFAIAPHGKGRRAGCRGVRHADSALHAGETFIADLVRSPTDLGLVLADDEVSLRPETQVDRDANVPTPEERLDRLFRSTDSAKVLFGALHDIRKDLHTQSGSTTPAPTPAKTKAWLKSFLP